MIVLLKPAIDFYLQSLEHFHRSSTVSNEEDLPVMKYLLANGNTSVYQWRTGGQRPVSLERPTFNYQSIEKDNEEDLVLDLDLDLSDGQNINTDLIESIEGIEIKQTSDQQETIDFETVGMKMNEKTERERSLFRKVRSIGQRSILFLNYSLLLFPRTAIIPIPSRMHLEKRLSMDPTIIQVSFFIRNLFFTLFLSLFNLVDDGIARGQDALTLLENRPTYTLFLHELIRVCFSLFAHGSTIFCLFSFNRSSSNV